MSSIQPLVMIILNLLRFTQIQVKCVLLKDMPINNLVTTLVPLWVIYQVKFLASTIEDLISVFM